MSECADAVGSDCRPAKFCEDYSAGARYRREKSEPTLLLLFRRKPLRVFCFQLVGTGLDKLLCLRQTTFGDGNIQTGRFDSVSSGNGADYLSKFLVRWLSFHLFTGLMPKLVEVRTWAIFRAHREYCMRKILRSWCGETGSSLPMLAATQLPSVESLQPATIAIFTGLNLARARRHNSTQRQPFDRK